MTAVKKMQETKMKLASLKKLEIQLTQENNKWIVKKEGRIIGWGVNYSQAYMIATEIAKKMIKKMIEATGFEIDHDADCTYEDILHQIA